MANGTRASTEPLPQEELLKRRALLLKCPLFTLCGPDTMRVCAENMQRQEYAPGDIVRKQGESTSDLFILASGDVSQNFVTADRMQESRGEFPQCFGSLDVLRGEEAQYSVVAKTNTVVYKIPREFFLTQLSNATFSKDIIMSLSAELKEQSFFTRTPLLQQQNFQAPIFATTVASTVESFYRSAMNAQINQRLTGVSGSLFPNMHVQVPSRVLYINGFKYLRYWLDNNVKPEDYPHSETAVRLGCAVAPGVIMTPVSSMLEACNATSNVEPLATRWLRGIVPRCGREIIFGIGLNQMSDYFAERAPDSVSDAFSNMYGSLCAGVVSGYLSHVPHNLSTMKLMQPQLSYGQHFKALALKWETRLSFIESPGIRRWSAYALSVVAPRGLLVRTTQVVGSFIILNGIIHLFTSTGLSKISFFGMGAHDEDKATA